MANNTSKLLFFFFQDMNRSNPYFFGEAWSLSVEEWFYFLFPLLALRMIRFQASSKRVKGLLVLCTTFIVLEIILKFYLALFTNLNWDSFLYYCTWLRTDSCAYGVLLACLLKLKPRLKARDLLFVILIFILLYSILYGLKDIYLVHPIYPGFKALVFPLNSICCAFIVFLFYKANFQNNLLSKLAITGSLISYAIYLIHLPVETLLTGIVIKTELPKVLALGSYFIFSITGAFFVFRFFELPILKWARQCIKNKPI